MLLRVPSEKVFDHSICTTKEQKTRLQRLASAMPNSVMPSVGPFEVIKVTFLCTSGSYETYFKTKIAPLRSL